MIIHLHKLEFLISKCMIIMLNAIYERIENILWGIVYIINYKINENGIRFILFDSANLYLGQVSNSFRLTFFFKL